MTYGWAVPLPAEYDPEESVQKTLEEAADGVRAKYPRYRGHHQGVAGPPRPGTRRGLQGGQAPGRRKPGPWRVRRDALGIGRRALRRARSLPGPGAPCLRLTATPVTHSRRTQARWSPVRSSARRPRDSCFRGASPHVRQILEIPRPRDPPVRERRSCAAAPNRGRRRPRSTRRPPPVTPASCATRSAASRWTVACSWSSPACSRSPTAWMIRSRAPTALDIRAAQRSAA